MSYMAARTQAAPGAPLFLTFHGTGGNEHQFHDFARQMMPTAHVTSPRGDVSEGGALRYFRRTAEGVYDMDDLVRRAQAMGDFIAAEKARLNAARVIALGYSNGANIIAAVAFARPELIDEMILMHPLIPFTPAAQPGLKGRRILVTAGENDPICPAPLTRSLADYLVRQGADVATVWHGGGHDVQHQEIAAVQDFLG